MGSVHDANPGPRRRFHRFWRTAEAVAWTTGIALLVPSGAWYVDGLTGSQQAIRRFAVLQAAVQQPVSATDVTLWSPGRVDAWRHAFQLPSPPPLGVLRIPRIHLEVPIFAGTSEVALNQGLGHIEDTPIPGTPGNSGLAGHRDGFFRGLKDIAADDVIELDTLHGKEIYRIEKTWIVNPEDVSVLEPTNDQSLTLVTCYPFYFVGSAPQRFIVRAVRAEGDSTR